MFLYRNVGGPCQIKAPSWSKLQIGRMCKSYLVGTTYAQRCLKYENQGTKSWPGSDCWRDKLFLRFPVHESSIQSGQNSSSLSLWEEGWCTLSISLYSWDRWVSFKSTYGWHFQTCKKKKHQERSIETGECVLSNGDGVKNRKRNQERNPSGRGHGRGQQWDMKMRWNLLIIYILPQAIFPPLPPLTLNINKCWLHKISVW